MCTAVCFTPHGSYFGRNFDLDITYGEKVIVTPRNFPFSFRKMPDCPSHYAMVGIGTEREGYPLYYDAVNEKGLGAAGLNFPHSARYMPPSDIKDNIAPFELIPYILCKCDSVNRAVEMLKRISVAKIPFSDELPLSNLHWMFSDKERSVVAEPTAEGLKIYDNPTGVLTNEPPFPVQMQNLNGFLHLSPHTPENTFSQNLPLYAFSFGMGALGLPGDLSSPSRFVRAVFTKENSICPKGERTELAQFFHILNSVAQTRGCVCTEGNRNEITKYSCGCNLSSMVYFYTTYENSGLTAVDMSREDLNSTGLITYPLQETPSVIFQN